MAAQNSLPDNNTISRQIKSFSSQLTLPALLGRAGAYSPQPPVKPSLCRGSHSPDVTLRVMLGSGDSSGPIARV